MKKCSICKQEKELSEFNKNKCKKDGLNTLCKNCSKERSKKYYEENTEHHKEVIYKRKKDYYTTVREFILKYLLGHPCTDCGNEDTRVLEFDHLPQFKKEYNISDLLRNGNSIKTLEKEIAKCDVVCANCHRIRTIERQDVNYRKIPS